MKRNLINFIARVQFALKIGRIAMSENDNQAIGEIVREYKWTRQSTIAYHMDFYAENVRKSYASRRDFDGNKTTITFWR